MLRKIVLMLSLTFPVVLFAVPEGHVQVDGQIIYKRGGKKMETEIKNGKWGKFISKDLIEYIVGKSHGYLLVTKT